MTERATCQVCDGAGYQWMAPHGINPFNVRLPQLASMVEKRICWQCHGTGRAVGEEARAKEGK